ncbi:hypothetical protein [Sphaerochaeta sp. UBA5836]|uniref:hypothetical protein n=1 Tax=Sphaerochaeta sp. UBA5836 TaxID=1947474 RepID=UPI0025F04218|nr:hypothetical protein [Sphaerochaeta sp. UBA5836]
MFENARKLSTIRKQALKSLLRKFDESGREIIEMHVLDDSGFLSPYAGANGKVISSEATSFLDNSVVLPVTFKHGIIIHITSACIDEQERIEYETAIRNRYRSRLTELSQSMLRNTIFGIGMSIVGVLILTFAIIMTYHNPGSIVLEVTYIAAWVFLWEAVDLLFLERSNLRYEQTKALTLYEAKIVFT